MNSGIAAASAGAVVNMMRWPQEARVEYTAASCLPARYPGYECGLCAEACPTRAIRLENGVPALGEDCIGCGQCVVACPTSALATEGFSLPATAPTAANILSIDCWRVPLTESPAATWRVPCLGGIGTGWLLALFDRLDGETPRTIRLLDRGGCRACPAGPGIARFHAALDEARALLSACGVADAVLPAPTFMPAQRALTPSIPTDASAVPIERRQFFRRLLGSTARAVETVTASVTSVASVAPLAPASDMTLHHEVLPIENLRITTALANIARRRGHIPPAPALPQLSVAECDAHGVCAKVCPTAALKRVEDANGQGAALDFHAALCIACGQCERICPDRALRLSHAGGRGGSETLIRWTAHHCGRCGETFYGATGDTCPPCRKEHDLFEGAAALFGPAA